MYFCSCKIGVADISSSLSPTGALTTAVSPAVFPLNSQEWIFRAWQGLRIAVEGGPGSSSSMEEYATWGSAKSHIHSFSAICPCSQGHILALLPGQSSWWALELAAFLVVAANHGKTMLGGIQPPGMAFSFRLLQLPGKLPVPMPAREVYQQWKFLLLAASKRR